MVADLPVTRGRAAQRAAGKPLVYAGPAAELVPVALFRPVDDSVSAATGHIDVSVGNRSIQLRAGVDSDQVFISGSIRSTLLARAE